MRKAFSTCFAHGEGETGTKRACTRADFGRPEESLYCLFIGVGPPLAAYFHQISVASLSFTNDLLSGFPAEFLPYQL